MLPRTPMVRWLAVVFFLVVVFYFHPNFSGSSIPASSATSNVTPTHVAGGVDDMSYVKELLKENSIGPEITYASRTIRYVPDATERYQITELEEPLFPQRFSNVTINKETALPSDRLLEVHVKQSPRPDQVDASSLLFGASTTYKRLNEKVTSPVREWQRWLTDGNGHSNGAGLILALFNATDGELESAYNQLAAAGINATVVPSDPKLDMPGRYVDLVQMLYNHPTRGERKYFALIDDDTFFPAMTELLRTLKHYNPKKPYYIGTFTERIDWLLSNRVPMAYGGGGIFLTAPVAREIVKLPCLQKNEAGVYVVGGDQGDRLLYNCLHKHTDITLTYLPLLHQLDQFGDPSGFYESGQQPLSIHHFKSWHHMSPAMTHTVADACGEDCVLQRFQFGDNFIISNGYSVVEYPHGIDFDLLQMEGTFDYGGEDKVQQEVVFSYAFGMLRKSLNKTGKKKSWELLGAVKEGDGRVKQVYLKRRGDVRWRAEGDAAPERDSVVVLTWVP
jgi:hypothetical protein